MITSPTEEQQAIWAATRAPDSLMISAYAGTGKTSTLEYIAPQIKVPGLALAFTKSIKEELGKRFPGNFSVQTMNGLGYASLRRALPMVNFQLDDKKLGKLISHVLKENKVEASSEQWDGLRRLVSLAMLAGIVPGDAGANPLTPDTPDDWWAIAEDGGFLRDDFLFLFPLARETLEANNKLVRSGQVSFDDMVYYSTCIEPKGFPKFPVLLVDEAQDLSPLNHAMLQAAMRPDGRLIAVGDAKQAIYAFRGADSDSIGKIRALRGDWITLPLATTFRCPRLVVERQQSHAPGFKAWSGVKPGLFHKFRSTWDEEGGELSGGDWNFRDLEARLPSPEASLAVLCRNNGPLLGLAFKLIRQRISVTMLGRDSGQDLRALARKLFSPDDNQERMLSILADWEMSETSLAVANGKEEKVNGISDRADCLRAVLSFAEVQDLKSLVAALRDLFSRETGRVTLSSIHKAKGLEWDLVLHLDPWRIPSKWAKEAARKGNTRQLEQEKNLRYVCETRTRNVLLEADFKEFV